MQLLAAGWSACFIGAMRQAVADKRVRFPADAYMDTGVDLVLGEDGYNLHARLNSLLPGIEREVALDIAEAAHQTCPYSKATMGNINVDINVL